MLGRGHRRGDHAPHSWLASALHEQVTFYVPLLRLTALLAVVPLA